MRRTDSKDIGLIFLGLAIVLLALFAGGCPKKKATQGEFTGALPGKVSDSTAKGTRIKSNSAINPALKPHIDAGLDKAFDIASSPPNNYSGFMRHGSYTVGLWPRSNKCQNPGFLIRADGSEWDGSIFDKDPRPGKVLLCIAGIARQYASGIGGQPQGSFGMLVVDDLGLMATIVWFEAEHEILYGVDINRWINTAGVHNHPILGHGDALAGPTWEAHTFEPKEDMQIGDLTAKAGDRFCLLLTK